jgi:sigma-B regulation protein RsbU (phosphoserine phosphatase)
MSAESYSVLFAPEALLPQLQPVIELVSEDPQVELQLVSTLESLRQRLAERRPQLLLVVMEGGQAVELQALTEMMDPYPVVLLAIDQSPQQLLDALRQGCSDLFSLPLEDVTAFRQSLAKQQGRARLLSQSQYYRDELEQSLAVLKADQQAGRHVQLKMLPRNDITINNYHFEYRIKPSLFLSGDFVDYFRISDSLSMFYLADISGHGASSAFVTVLLKNMTNRLLRNYNRGSSFDILSPVDVLARVNKDLLATGLGKHMTIFVGLLDQVENTLQYGVGGHFPMPILKQGARVEYLAGSGMPVGLFEDAQFEGRIVELEDEFCLTLFSDGVLEVLDQPNLKAKEKCLLDVAAQGYDDLSDLGVKLGIDQIEEAPDDIAALSVSRKL